MSLVFNSERPALYPVNIDILISTPVYNASIFPYIQWQSSYISFLQGQCYFVHTFSDSVVLFLINNDIPALFLPTITAYHSCLFYNGFFFVLCTTTVCLYFSSKLAVYFPLSTMNFYFLSLVFNDRLSFYLSIITQ